MKVCSRKRRPDGAAWELPLLVQQTELPRSAVTASVVFLLRETRRRTRDCSEEGRRGPSTKDSPLKAYSRATKST